MHVNEVAKRMRLGKWANDVYTDVIETTVRKFKLVEWGRCVSLDFRLLARDAGACPSADITVKAIPNKACSEEFTGGLSAWMSEVVNQIEDFSSKWLGDYGSSVALGNIAEKWEVVVILQWDIHELQTGGTGL